MSCFPPPSPDVGLLFSETKNTGLCKIVNLRQIPPEASGTEHVGRRMLELQRFQSACFLSSLFSHRYLIKFLAKLAQTSDINKMTPSNIAIVLGPNLLWAKTEG